MPWRPDLQTSGPIRHARSIRRSLEADESKNMSAVLQDDGSMQRPPEAQPSRVRKLGRKLLERGDTCQWISSMTQVNPAPPGSSFAKSGSDTVVAKASEAGAKSLSQAATCNNPARPADVTYNATTTGLVSGTAVQVADPSSCPGSKTPGCSSSSSNRDERRDTGDGTEMNADAPAQPSQLSHTDECDCSVVSGVDPSQACSDLLDGSTFEEKLQLIRQQKLKLTMEEKRLQEEIEKKRREASQAAEQEGNNEQVQTAVVDQTATKTKVDTSAFAAWGVETRRRRLKGSLACGYARRDEGSVGSLIWASNGEGETHHSKSTMSSEPERLSSLKQGSSSTIRDLLSQTSFLRSQSNLQSDRGKDLSSAADVMASQTPTDCDDEYEVSDSSFCAVSSS